eukprot:11337796-Prorocentrum_lima.AAC.1
MLDGADNSPTMHEASAGEPGIDLEKKQQEAKETGQAHRTRQDTNVGRGIDLDRKTKRGNRD